MPTEIPNFGSVSQRPRQNPEFTPGAGFSSEDYYVWTRCDGHASAREIILMVGLGFDRSAAILDKLRQAGAILLDGETPESVRTRAAPEVPERPVDEDLGDLSPEETAALAEEVALSDAEKRRILTVRRKLGSADHFELLGVSREADGREIKRAYFRISKAFHPDRHYGQELGAFGAWLSEIFEACTSAFETLRDRKARAAYEAGLRGEASGRTHERAQTVEEHATDLFAQACDREVHGDLERALALFAAACRASPTPRHLRRAALCAQRAGKLSQALEYAKKVAGLCPDDPSTLRILAEVYRATDRLEEAESVLARAVDIDTENDKLLAGLRADLEAVRRALGKPGRTGKVE